MATIPQPRTTPTCISLHLTFQQSQVTTIKHLNTRCASRVAPHQIQASLYSAKSLHSSILMSSLRIVPTIHRLTLLDQLLIMEIHSDTDQSRVSSTTITTMTIFSYIISLQKSRINSISSLVLGKYCVPNSEAIKKEAIKQFKDTFYEKYNVDKFSDYVMDLINCWQVMLICFGAAFIFGMIYLVILRCFAGLLVWTTIFGILGSLGGGGYWLYHMRNNYDQSDNNYKYLQYGAYALWGLAGLFFLIVLCCCSRIRLAVAIMKVTSQFVYNTPSILLLPIIFLALCAGWIVFWVYTAVYVFSVGNIEPRESPFSFVSTIKWTTQTRYIFLYHLFGGLWVNAFLIGCFQFIVAAACAIWYFSFSTDVAGKGSMRTGAKWILRYHFGSIAFGSFIIALVQFIRIIFEYYRKKIQAANKNNPVVKCLLCCTSYLLACLERCVKFITKNAYIQVAITGKNFCRSAWNGFLLVVRNVFRFGAVHTLGAIFMFLGRLFIICLTVIACFIQVEYWPYFADKLSSPYFPCIVAGIIGFLVGGIFVSIFSFASDTVL